MKKIPVEFEKLNDVHIAFCQHGSGHDLILLHGNSESKSIFFRHQTQHFTAFHTHALDSRGHGQSVSNDNQLSIEQISEDVIRFCQARAIHRAHIIGYSDGGNIALHLARKAPHLFPRVLAISPNTLVSGTEEKTLKLIQNLYKVMGFIHRLGLNMKKHMLRFELMLTDIGLRDEELMNIKTRGKIIYAENDMIKEDHILHIASLIPGSEVEKIPGCTHMSIIHDPYAIQVMGNFVSP